MIGPPAAARSLVARPGAAVALSVGLALVTVWASIAISYATNWPIGFLVGAFSALSYAAARSWTAWRRRVPAVRAGARAAAIAA